MSFKADYDVRDDGICVIRPEGRLNAVSVAAFKKEATDFFDKKEVTKVVVDMAKVDFVDSSGLSVLITLLRKIREKDGFFRIAAVNPDALKIFKLTMLDRVFEIYPDVEKAVSGDKSV